MRRLHGWAKWAYPRYGAPEGAWWTDAYRLLEDHENWKAQQQVAQINSISGLQEGGNARLPLVTVEKIIACRKAGYRPRLFLDELGKVALTASKVAALFDLVNAVYENDGQLVIGTNMTPRELSSFLGERIGQATIRRILESRDVDAGYGENTNTLLDFYEAPLRGTSVENATVGKNPSRNA